MATFSSEFELNLNIPIDQLLLSPSHYKKERKNEPLSQYAFGIKEI